MAIDNLQIFAVTTFIWKKYIVENYTVTKFKLVPSRRKFRSQTSDNMERWKAEQGSAERRGRLAERRSEEKE